jgi:hypothetical protein
MKKADIEAQLTILARYRHPALRCLVTEEVGRWRGEISATKGRGKKAVTVKLTSLWRPTLPELRNALSEYLTFHRGLSAAKQKTLDDFVPQ